MEALVYHLQAHQDTKHLVDYEEVYFLLIILSDFLALAPASVGAISAVRLHLPDHLLCDEIS